jgi:hypothetical protein
MCSRCGRCAGGACMSPEAQKIVRNCWEYWNCGEDKHKNCKAAKYDMGRYCWLLTGEDMSPVVRRNFKHCWECAWFIKLRDEIYE